MFDVRMHLSAGQDMYPAGAEWKTFNTAQRLVRRDMLRLYGIRRHLVPRGVGLRNAGEPTWDTHVFFTLQVWLTGHLIALFVPTR